MTLYFEKRIEFQRVFMAIEITDLSIKSLTHQRVLEQWGPIQYPEVRGSRETIFKSAQKASQYIEAVKKSLQEEGFQTYDGPHDPQLTKERDILFENALKKAKTLKETGAERIIFKEAADPDEWLLLEDEYKIILPTSYKKFVHEWNGITFNPAMPECFLYTLDQIRERHEQLLAREGADYRETHYLPVGESGNGEALVIAPSDITRKETPILDAFHEEKPKDWRPMFENFAELFICYYGRRNKYAPLSTPLATHWQPQKIKSEEI